MATTKATTKSTSRTRPATKATKSTEVLPHSHDDLAAKIAALEGQMQALTKSLSDVASTLADLEAKPSPELEDPRVNELIRKLRTLCAHLRGRRVNMPSF